MERILREFVRRRAGDRCEYCGISQESDFFFRFHIEHVVARQHGGKTSEDNLALACHHCNLHKGPNLSGIDPISGELVPLFHPRRDQWQQHFMRRGPLVIGLTRTGRATVQVLAINAPTCVEFRQAVP